MSFPYSSLNDTLPYAYGYDWASYATQLQHVMAAMPWRYALSDPRYLLAAVGGAASLAAAAQSSTEGASGAQESSGDRELSQAELYELEKGFFEAEAAKRPLVSPVVPLTSLKGEYANAGIIAKIDWLGSNGWTGLRRSRGDGDCFYRSLAFSYVERIITAPDLNLAVASSLSTLEASLKDLELVGFDRMAFEDFYDELRALITNIVQPDGHSGELLTPVRLLKHFQDDTVSNSIVVFLRLLTSAFIRLNVDDFGAFLFDPETFEPMDVRSFCERHVEPTGKEADEPQVIALSRALKIPVDVAYVAGDRASSSDGHVSFVRYEAEASDGANPVTLLYRPGHYDILEKKERVEGEQ